MGHLLVEPREWSQGPGQAYRKVNLFATEHFFSLQVILLESD